MLIALAVGTALRGRRDALRGPAGLALALALGLETSVLLLLGLGPAGLPWTPLTLCLCGAAGLAAVVLRKRRRPVVSIAAGQDGAGPPRLAGGWERAAQLVLLAALGLFLWKLAAAPLWSWDHYAMWGVKARRMVEGGRLDLDVLAHPTLLYSRPGLPLGLPALWRFLALGAEPGAALFKAAHALLALGLAAMVRAGARQAGAPAAAADVLAALLAVSPLFWDTVGLGLADLPLAFWAAGGLLLGLHALGRPTAGTSRNSVPRSASAWLTAGLLLGFLPWIKEEGWPLCAVLVAALALLALGAGRGREIVWLAAPVLALGLFARAYAARALPRGYSFFDGDWLGRGAERLPRLPEVAGHLLRHLLDPSWLGLWVLFAAGLLAAVAQRRSSSAAVALALLLAVGTQLAIYLGVLLVAGPDPLDHLKASALRFGSALLPVGLIAFGSLLAPPPASADPDEPRTIPEEPASF